MTGRRPFIDAIRDPRNAGVASPSLVFADWLDERGDAAAAELIRVQCANVGRPASTRLGRDLEIFGSADRPRFPGFPPAAWFGRVDHGYSRCDDGVYLDAHAWRPDSGNRDATRSATGRPAGVVRRGLLECVVAPWRWVRRHLDEVYAHQPIKAVRVIGRIPLAGPGGLCDFLGLGHYHWTDAINPAEALKASGRWPHVEFKVGGDAALDNGQVTLIAPGLSFDSSRHLGRPAYDVAGAAGLDQQSYIAVGREVARPSPPWFVQGMHIGAVRACHVRVAVVGARGYDNPSFSGSVYSVDVGWVPDGFTLPTGTLLASNRDGRLRPWLGPDDAWSVGGQVVYDPYVDPAASGL